MGKETICLLLHIFCVMAVSSHSYWRTSWEDTLHTYATGPLLCAHDGYQKNDGCICKPHFTRSACTQRVCLNEGTRRSFSGDQGCRCPPGFLGTSCEPVKCVSGNTHSFYEEIEKQSIYVLVTYNTFMNATIVKNNDDPIVAVCQAARNSTINNLFWSIDAPLTTKILTGTTVQDCVSDAKILCDPLSSCDPNTLTVDNINSIIDQSQANSQVLIITNTALPANSSVNEIIRKAIARRIKVHVIAFAPETAIINSDFNTRPGYSTLRSIADSTFGFYITPYSGFTNALMGSTSVSEAIYQIFDLISNNVAAVAVEPAKTAQQVLRAVGRNKYYISFRSLGSSPEDIDFTTSPSGLKLEHDTGFWKMYSAQEKNGMANFTFQYKGSGPDFNVQVLSSYPLRTFVAFSSSDLIDASSPYATIVNVSDTFMAIAKKLPISPPAGEPTGAVICISHNRCRRVIAANTSPPGVCRWRCM